MDKQDVVLKIIEKTIKGNELLNYIVTKLII